MSKAIFAKVCIGLCITFVLILGILHVLEPEFNSDGHLISEYELGNYGWLMTLAFWSLAGASLALWLVIKDNLHSLAGRIAFWGLLLIAVAYVGAGVFYPDPSSGSGLPLNPADINPNAVAPTLNATLHGFAGIIAIFGSPIVFTLIAKSLSQAPRYLKNARLGWLTIIVWIGFLSFPVSLTLYYTLQDPAGLDVRLWVSLTNRLMMLTYAAWMIVCAKEANASS